MLKPLTMSPAVALVLSGAALAQAPPLGLDLYRPVPEDNPTTSAKIVLGKQLFREKRLSRDNSIACADCHQPKRAFTDGRAKAIGAYRRQGPRNVPTLVNRAWGESFFWDGRIPTLEQQVIQPILAKNEMDLTLEEAVKRLSERRRYRRGFQKSFGRGPNADDLSRALATYVRTILSGDSPFDRYLFGERDSLSRQELSGLKVFRGKARCSVCHSGPTFSDEEFHNTGVTWCAGKPLDEGRAVVTKREEDRGKFKTPTLREIARTAPYMHDGSMETLEDVVAFYNDGGRSNPYLDPELHPLKLTDDEKTELVAFLRALTGKVTEGR